VKRNTATFAIDNFEQFKQQMLCWSNQFNICCLLDNHQYASAHHSIECILAAGALTSFSPPSNGALVALKAFQKHTNDWLFGHVGYDFKNTLEAFPSPHRADDLIQFPDMFFFQPEVVIQLSIYQVEISVVDLSAASIFAAILQQSTAANELNAISLQPRISKEDYLKTIHQLQAHIQRGDCYEINFCQEFFAKEAQINPLHVYNQLTKISPTPFACYYKLNNKFLLCSSPERYIKKTGNHIISQPIKGTVKRDIENEQNDALLKKELSENAKERSENVMIVDMVRNDLSKICAEGSVTVEELFGIYSFPQVHQMISTIAGELQAGTDFSDLLKATFPMGSMTGAPKRKVMELIEQYEQSKRGLYAGCVGYLSPNNDFDFNVVIRSILYNSTTQYLSYHVGSAITYNSLPEKEYEECLLKAEGMNKVLMPF